MIARPIDGNLAAQARRLWPGDQAMQIRWLRAVRVVRHTKRGWLAERRVERKAA